MNAIVRMNKRNIHVTHSNSNIGTFQGDAIVNTIAGHADNVAISLQRFNYLQFMLWRDPIEDAHVVNALFELQIGHLVNIRARQYNMMNGIQTDEISNSNGRFL